MFWEYRFCHINVAQYLQTQKIKSDPFKLYLQKAT